MNNVMYPEDPMRVGTPNSPVTIEDSRAKIRREIATAIAAGLVNNWEQFSGKEWVASSAISIADELLRQLGDPK